MKKINFDFIPPHLNCKNCGECCGLVPIGEKEYEDIKKYCIDNNVIPKNVGIFDCPFRDNENKKCLIYEVRPEICRRFICSKSMPEIEDAKKLCEKTRETVSMRNIFFDGEPL
ncbi:MAG TPA: YkgJ family cysteine cluster protein, partial [Romboutsia timonensis]|nr:YkgJ family cysteine cluster protein [Romboutsia timonensis]